MSTLNSQPLTILPDPDPDEGYQTPSNTTPKEATPRTPDISAEPVSRVDDDPPATKPTRKPRTTTTRRKTTPKKSAVVLSDAQRKEIEMRVESRVRDELEAQYQRALHAAIVETQAIALAAVVPRPPRTMIGRALSWFVGLFCEGPAPAEFVAAQMAAHNNLLYGQQTQTNGYSPYQYPAGLRPDGMR